MPREVIVDLPCRVKFELGEQSLRAGSNRLINLLHAKERIQAIKARPRQDGADLGAMTIKLPVLTDTGTAELATTVAELEAEVAFLAPLEPYCANCPANVHLRSFGCVGGLAYPVSKAIEEYAMSRLAASDRVGGLLLLQTLNEKSFDGSITRGYRAESKFEAFSAVVKPLAENAYNKTTLSSDEVFDTLLFSGPIAPWLSLNMLLWFDAVSLDDQIPVTVDDALKLTRMDLVDRTKRTKCLLGPPSPGLKAEAFRGFLKLLHIGWSRDLAVMIES